MKGSLPDMRFKVDSSFLPVLEKYCSTSFASTVLDEKPTVIQLGLLYRYGIISLCAF